MKKVTIYTDGACSGNPGAGGWAAVLIYNEHEKLVSGHDRSTTNNRMELFAIIQGLNQLKERCEVTVYSDSAYAVNAFNSGWLDSWQNNGWKSTDGSPVKNQDLWNDLLLKTSKHKVKFLKVKGHAGDKYNCMCDEAARNEVKKVHN